jgi:lysophospholipase L1-like esterase
MRGPERPLAKAPGVFRIVGIGDSVMFGWGVAEEDGYLAVVERELARRFPGRRLEAWNLAVPGYNAVQEVESFARKADLLRPDLLVVGWVGNDADLPNFLAERARPWALDGSFLWAFASRRWRADDGRVAGIGLFEAPIDETTHRYVQRREDVPRRYWPLVGRDNMMDAYRRLARLTKERGIPVAVVFGAGPRAFKSFCEELGFLVVESQHRVLRYEQEHGVDRYTALRLSRTDPHPNERGHELIAESLIEAIAARGAIRSRLATAGSE